MSTSSHESRFAASWLQFLRSPFPTKASLQQSSARAGNHLGILESIASWARTSPATTAIGNSVESLSYADLESQSYALARSLKSLGVGPETIVALLLERSAALGIA